MKSGCRNQTSIWFLSVFCLTGVGLSLATEVTTIQLKWSNGSKSLAVCVDKNGWYVSVVPFEVEEKKLQSPKFVHETAYIATNLLHFDAHQRLCLIEVLEAVDNPKAAKIAKSKSPGPKAGAGLTCLLGGEQCRSTVAGKEWSYRGQAFALPLLRVRMADPDHECPPGSTLLDESGYMAGLITPHDLESEDEALVIPASRIGKLITDMRQYKKSGPVWFGLVFMNETSAPEIVKVKPGSPAEKAGLRKGDVILSIDKIEVEDLDELEEVVRSLPAGKEVEVEVLRGVEGETMSVVPQFAEVVH